MGYIDNSAHGVPAFNTPSVFGKLADAGQTWKICGYSQRPLTAYDFPDTVCPGPGCTVESGFEKFQSDVAGGQLAAFSYIEPEWATYPRRSDPPSTTQADNEHNFQVENDQHPVSNLAVGEKLIYDVYAALSGNQASGRRACLSSPTTSTEGTMTTCPPKPAPPHPTTTPRQGSTSPASESGSRR